MGLLVVLSPGGVTYSYNLATDTDLSNLVFVGSARDSASTFAKTSPGSVATTSSAHSSHSSRTSTRYQEKYDTPSGSRVSTRKRDHGISSSHKFPRPIIRKECVICRDEPGYFPKRTPTEKCAHKVEACLDCLRRTIQVAIEDQNFGGEENTCIKCPTIGCDQWMEYSDIEYWADQAVFMRYDKILLQYALQARDDFLYCLDPDCGEGQIHAEKEQNPLVVCHSCGARQCFVHRIPWHEGYTCRRWDKRAVYKAEDKASHDYILSTTKGCPNPKCGRRITKTAGCDHMTCRKPAGCGHEFCWLCLAPWNTINTTGHYDYCPDYVGFLGGNPAATRLRFRI